MRSPESSSAVALAQRAARLHVLLDRRISRLLASLGLTRGELDVLGALARGGDGGMNPSALAGALLLTTGGLSNILRRLEVAGLVTRDPSPDDGRGRTIRITEDGARRGRDAADAVSAAIERHLRGVDPGTLAQGADVLRSVLGALDAEP